MIMNDALETTVHHDAIIVGAGVAGAATATLLARAGWSVAVVEKTRFPRRKVCGECVAASNLPLLETLGVATSVFDKAGMALQNVALLHADGEVRANLPRAGHARFPWGCAVGRESLDTALLGEACAAGAKVMQPWLVQGITGAPGAWQCQVRSIESDERRTLHGSVLIDAHGSWESLAGVPVTGDRSAAAERSAAGRASGKVARHDDDLLAFKANFLGSSHREATISVLALDGGYGGMVVAGDAVTTIACCIRRDRLNALRRQMPGMRAGLAVEAWLKQENAGVESVLNGALRSGAWLASGPLRPGIRLSGADRILRVGNAAGEAHPILGEGMSMALQSAAMLSARLLAHDPASPGLSTRIAAPYAIAWRRAFAQRLRLAAGFAHVAMRPATARALIALTRACPPLLTHGARWGGKTRSASESIDVALLRENPT